MKRGHEVVDPVPFEVALRRRAWIETLLVVLMA